MRGVFLTIYILIYLVAATQSRYDTACNCNIGYTIKFPVQAEKDKVSGTVIIEFEEAENCVWSNPIVIQKAGHGFDEEALRVMKRTIISHNACVLKCKSNLCTKRKLKQSFKFDLRGD